METLATICDSCNNWQWGLIALGMIVGLFLVSCLIAWPFAKWSRDADYRRQMKEARWREQHGWFNGNTGRHEKEQPLSATRERGSDE